MKVMKHTVIMLTLILLFSCKLERGTEVRSVIESKSAGLLGDVAVTPLSFSNRPISAWEIGARAACGDTTPQRHSRLDNLEYEINPESAFYNGKRLLGKGDHMLCRYQPATAQNMENTRRLFSDKALALKIKYPPSYSNAPPPHVSFSSGMAINITPQKYGELFIGRCLAFQNVGGINFCKTKDRDDGRTIWLVPIAPGMAGVGGVSQHAVTTTIPGKGGGATTITGPGKGGGTVTTPGKSGGTTTITGPGKGGGGTVTTPGKGGQTIVGQSGMQTGGRIAMSIKLPYANTPVPLSVLVPSFNLEMLSILQGSGGGGGLPPPVLPPNPDELHGSLLDGERISFMVIKPKGLFKNPNEAKFLKLTIKATETKPHEGRLSGVFKTAIGIPTTIVGGLLAVGASSLGLKSGSSHKILGTTVLTTGATTTVLGVMDLKRWYDNVTEVGAQKQFAVPNTDKCPALYGG